VQAAQEEEAIRQLETVPTEKEPAPTLARLDIDAPPTEPGSIGKLAWRERATVSGRVKAVRLAAFADSPSLEVELWDESGGVLLVFYGRRSIPGIETGAHLTATGTVGERNGKLAIANPVYELIAPAYE
jgi:RecG-like helicase